jgi:HK97 family phage major capsid protein
MQIALAPQQSVGGGSNGGAVLLQGMLQPQGTHIRFDSGSEDEEDGQEQEQQQLQQVDQLAAAMQQLAAGAASPAEEDHSTRQANGEEQQAKKAKKKKKNKGPAQQGQAEQGQALPLPQQQAAGIVQGSIVAVTGGGGRRSGTLHLPATMDRKLEKYWLQRYSLFSRCAVLSAGSQPTAKLSPSPTAAAAGASLAQLTQ